MTYSWNSTEGIRNSILEACRETSGMGRSWELT